MTRRARPYGTPGTVLIWVGSLLTAGSFVQLLFGIPLSEGFAPAGLSLGPLTLVAGTVLSFSRRPTGSRAEANAASDDGLRAIDDANTTLGDLSD